MKYRVEYRIERKEVLTVEADSRDAADDKAMAAITLVEGDEIVDTTIDEEEGDEEAAPA